MTTSILGTDVSLSDMAILLRVSERLGWDALGSACMGEEVSDTQLIDELEAIALQGGEAGGLAQRILSRYWETD